MSYFSLDNNEKSIYHFAYDTAISISNCADNDIVGHIGGRCTPKLIVTENSYEKEAIFNGNTWYGIRNNCYGMPSSGVWRWH
jgi:hypothetical protein